MDGATALYPVYSAFARAVYPNKKYNLYHSDVMCNNTPNAYKNLIDGKADIIFVARPSQEQLDYARSMNIEMVLTKFTLTPSPTGKNLAEILNR